MTRSHLDLATRNIPTSGDESLRQALLALPPQAAPADIDALSERVLAQWSERQGMAQAASRTSGGVLALGSRLRRHPLWLATASIATVVALASAVLLTRPDPALEELMQPDVLSQIAIGEM